MKRFLIILLSFCICLFSRGQMTAGMSAGISNTHFFLNADIGYTNQNLYTGFDLRAQPKGSNAAAFFGAKSFYIIRINDFHFGPAAGLYYRLVSTDNKSENGPAIGYGMKAGYKWISTEWMQVGKYTQFSIGVFAFIITKDKCR